MIADSALVRLAETLPQLAFTLASLRDVLAHQRRAAGEGDLQTVRALGIEREQLNARMSRLEGQRQTLQASLEREMNVRGLHAIAETGILDPSARDRMLDDIHDLRVTVVELQGEHERCAALLSAAAEVSRQSRAYPAAAAGEPPASDKPRFRAAGPIPTRPV